jgi:hypothetical protein
MYVFSIPSYTKYYAFMVSSFGLSTIRYQTCIYKTTCKRTIIWAITQFFHMFLFIYRSIDDPKIGRGSLIVLCMTKDWVYISTGLSTTLIFLNTYILTYLLTPWRRVLEKLTNFQLVKKFLAFYGTRMFITAFTSARHLSLSWASSVQSAPPHPTSWKSILILSSHLRLGLPSVA